MDRKNAAGNFREICERHGLAVTHQRQVIFETLTEMHGHPSPEAVYELVKVDIPSISLATVYKNLKTFEEHGLIREVSPITDQRDLRRMPPRIITWFAFAVKQSWTCPRPTSGRSA